MGLLSKTAGFLDHRFGWDRLPRPLGVLDPRRPSPDACGSGTSTTPASATRSRRPDEDTSARTLDGSHNDLDQPTMGMIGQRFGRNVPVAITEPERLPDILEPNPRLVSRELLTRDEFIPATIVNVLAGAWLQFEVHDWLSHGQSEAENPWEVELADDDPWYERPMRIARTRRDPSHRDDATPPTFVTADSHWWDGSQIYGSDAAFAAGDPLARGRQAPARPRRAAAARPRRQGRPRGRRRQLLARPRAPAHAVHARAQRHLRPARRGAPRARTTTSCTRRRVSSTRL